MTGSNVRACRGKGGDDYKRKRVWKIGSQLTKTKGKTSTSLKREGMSDWEEQRRKRGSHRPCMGWTRCMQIGTAKKQK